MLSSNQHSEQKYMQKHYISKENGDQTAYLHDDQDIQGIIVFTKSTRYETIVMGVHDWRVKNTINLHIYLSFSNPLWVESIEKIDLAHKTTLISPVFLSSSYFTLLPFPISITCIHHPNFHYNGWAWIPNISNFYINNQSNYPYLVNWTIMLAYFS